MLDTCGVADIQMARKHRRPVLAPAAGKRVLGCGRLLYLFETLDDLNSANDVMTNCSIIGWYLDLIQDNRPDGDD